MKPIEKCLLCKKEIDTKRSTFCELIDYIGQVKDSTGYYHRQCLNDLIKEKGEMIQNKMRDEIAETTGKIVENVLRKVNQGEKGDFRVK